jgi:hypothetical protein
MDPISSVGSAAKWYRLIHPAHAEDGRVNRLTVSAGLSRLVFRMNENEFFGGSSAEGSRARCRSTVPDL